MKDFNLKISEIKKAERFAAKETGKTCFLAAMSYSGADVFGWQDVLCEMDSAESGEYVSTVHLCVYMNDRRRSYVARPLFDDERRAEHECTFYQHPCQLCCRLQ